MTSFNDTETLSGLRQMIDLCRKCGHDLVLHRLEVEATIFNVEKYNETASALECEARVNNRFCGCRYVEKEDK